MHIPSPHTCILGLDNVTVSDFRAWAYSDVRSNRNRGVLAEFFVARALQCTQRPRVEWDAYDCVYKGLGIEVKCAAYLQSWPQKSLSGIFFDIAKKKAWFAETNTYSDAKIRSAFCYVFCLFKETDAEMANPLDLSQWEFYIMPTRLLDEKFSAQKKISLPVIKRFCAPVGFEGIKPEIDKWILAYPETTPR